MSMDYWSTTGIGFCVNDEEANISIEALRELLVKSKSPVSNEPNFEAMSIEDFEEYGRENAINNGIGLSSLIAEAISKLEGITISAVSNEYDYKYVGFCLAYPWEFSDKEKSLTKDSAIAILQKYASSLFDPGIEVDQFDIENWG